jgi:dTDP-4-dehydrorhamnose reductase
MKSNSEAKKTILVTGAQGQLGREFQALQASFPQYHFLFADRNELQIADEDSINNYFFNNDIDVCVNCAAFTAVDKAEQERELATSVNATAVGYLAKACKKNNTQFIHISTDYVFDGTATSPYKPDDKTSPVNFYGQTKLEGELNAIKENENSIIIRTAWVYSSFGNNFVKTMMRLMNERETIGVVNDQRGAPTYAADLAATIMQIIDKNNFVASIYHYSNKGNISWYDFAKEIAAQINTTCIVNPISTAQFPTAAARPAYSVLDTSKIEETYGFIIPEWKESLKECIKLMP